MRLEHINMTVNNIEQSYAFYAQLFDFKQRWAGTGSGKKGPVRAIHIGDDTTYLSLFEAENPGQAPADYGSTGINHLAFEVDNLQPLRGRLAAMGVLLHLDENYEPGQRIYFYDPNGVEVELVCYQRQAR
jgi:catechol 2,3-dioxygenase-like lactoylglutathione lyase family enzyme